MTDLPPGLITVADLYREISGMRTDVGKTLEKMAVIESRNALSDAIHADHEARLRIVERFRWTLLGAASVVGVASGIMSALLINLGHH